MNFSTLCQEQRGLTGIVSWPRVEGLGFKVDQSVATLLGTLGQHRIA